MDAKQFVHDTLGEIGVTVGGDSPADIHIHDERLTLLVPPGTRSAAHTGSTSILQARALPIERLCLCLKATEASRGAATALDVKRLLIRFTRIYSIV